MMEQMIVKRYIFHWCFQIWKRTIQSLVGI